MANASKLEWGGIDCDAVGVLEKTAEGLWFTVIELDAHLRIPAGGDAARAERLLEKAEKTCLVSKSLRSEVRLQVRVSAG